MSMRNAPQTQRAVRTAPAGVEAVERALRLLDAVGQVSEPASLAELAQRTGLYKSTLLRIAGSLARFGYLVRQDDGRFRLGPSLWTLGSRYRHRFKLEDCVRPELHRLVNATHETASFYVIDGEMRVCLYRADSPRSMRHHLDEGTRLPLDKGASGRVLSAFAPRPDPDGVGATTRRLGYYCSLGERDPDIAAVAVPVLDRSEQLQGAITVSGLISRFDDKARRAALKQLRESAQRLRSVLPGEPT
jgi:DNA-binding IclR family transcriptional regulator